MKQNYFIGLDIGTDSIGWAVTDTEYSLVKKRGKDFWGVYLFDPAETAEARRGYRTARRRIARRNLRMKLLQSIFAEEIAKIDPTFFLRLKNSPFVLEDKDGKLKGKNALFADELFEDKHYHNTFPTIYHLRNYLLTNQPQDIRFLYLAIHHIIKNRGHFLFEGQTFDVKDTSNVVEYFSVINTLFAENELSAFLPADMEEVFAVLKSRDFTKSDKAKRLQILLGAGKEKHLVATTKAMVGLEVKLSALYPNEELEEIKVNFEKEDFDTTVLPAIEDAVGLDEAELVRKLKSIYDWAMLSNILHDEAYISSAKIKIYEKHKSDLEWLKRVVREMDPSGALYNKVFKKQEQTNNYASYIGSHNGRYVKKCSQKDFYGFIRNNVPDEGILKEIEKGDFLPKQVSNANGVIPYQVHLAELQAILQNASKSFPFLLEKQDGMTVMEKIERLMTFRIPYFVGPLYTGGPFAWSVRNEGYERTPITPWNYDLAIDEEKSEQEFIRRMTNKCTYLIGEDVLPASSLLYSEYAFLNELNNLKVNGERSSQAKALIYEYARSHKKVTLKACLDLLKENGLVEKDATKEIFSGILDGKFNTSLEVYVTFRDILGDRVDTHSEKCEEIIELITLISDKSRLEKILKQRFGSFLSEAEIKRMKGLNYVKWGNFSKKLLTELFTAQSCDENGEVRSILQTMREEPKNFMQVLHEYGYAQAIEEYNRERTPTQKVTYQTVSDLYCSPSVKRAIWRSIELVREITKVMGGEPLKVFVEMARDKEDNGKKGQRTVSRKQKLLDLYASIKGEERKWIDEINGHEDTKFNSKRLVLYYMQMGKCVYTGKSIPLEHVFDTNICDIDHIYPQSKIKDDSFDNMVLVYKTENARKGDKYPLPPEMQTDRLGLWQMLKNKGLISERKFERLTRKTALTMDELADFINRQLVETRQSTKEVCNLLKRILPESEIVYSKAAIASDFKAENKLIKVRELNDLHHAKDAYINIVVGNVYNTKFQHNAKFFLQKNGYESYNLKHLFAHDIPHAWKVADKEKIFVTYRKNTCRIVRYATTGKGQLFDDNLVDKEKIKKGQAEKVPVKGQGPYSNTERYGGYASLKVSYFMLVRSKDRKGKILLTLEAISIYHDLQFKTQQDKIEYLKIRGFIEAEILIDKIKLNTLFCIDGSYAYIRGKSDVRVKWCNANELLLEEDQIAYLKEISNCFRDKKKYMRKELPLREEITAEENLKLYDTLIDKLSSPVYAGLCISGQAKRLLSKRDVFISLSLTQQLEVLFEALRLTQCNCSPSDFSLIGEKGDTSIRTSKTIQDRQVKIILQSPTGHYRTIIDCAQFL